MDEKIIDELLEKLNKETINIVVARKKFLYEEIKLKMYDILEEYTDSKFVISLNIDKSYSYNTNKDNNKRSYLSFRTQIAFVDENNKEKWGSSFSIHWEDGRLMMNHGCMGEFNYDNKGLVDRCIMMGKIWSDFNYIDNTLYLENYLEELDLEYKDEYLQLDNALTNYYREVEQEKREEEWEIWLKEYEVRLMKMDDEELAKERRRRRASQKKYNNVSPKVLDTIEKEVLRRKVGK